MTILALDHVQIAIPEGGEERALGFYVGVLGFREIEKPASLAGRGGCWLEGGAARLHLGVEPTFRPAVKAHPAFLVDDVAGIVRAAGCAGCDVRRDVPLPGYERVHVFDPFGNRVELMQRLP